MRLTRIVEEIIFYIILAVVMTTILFPIYWMAITSVKIERDVITDVPVFLPTYITLKHYEDVLIYQNFTRYIVNTFIVSIIAIGISLFAGSLAAYALTRLGLPANLDNIFLFITLLVRMLPTGAFVIPLYLILDSLGLINTLTGLAIAYQIYILPLSIWLLLGFFRSVPIEVEEAGLVDGASRLTVFRMIILPLVMPGLIATMIVDFMTIWNEYFYALIFLTAPDVMTISVVIGGYLTEYGTLWGQLCAAGLISSLPILILASYIQKYIVESFGYAGIVR